MMNFSSSVDWLLRYFSRSSSLGGMIQKFDRDDLVGNENISTLSQTLVYQALTNPSR